MPRRNEDAILILSPTRVELATLGQATPRRADSMSYDIGLWQDAIATGYRPFDHWFAQAATVLGLPKRAKIVVSVAGTSLRTEVTHHAGPERAVCGIAHASMAGQFDQNDVLYQVAVTRLEGRPEAESNSTRYFISAESDAVLDGIVAFVERAGFRCPGVTSLALAHAKAVCNLLAKQQETKLVCDMGENESIVAMGENRTIPLFRSFGVGVAAFTDVYRRVLEQHDDDAASVQRRARAFFFRIGVPGRSDVLDEALGLTGRDVLPMLQPVIQRLAVELKNTLRFGLEERDFESMHVELTGLASCVPGLAQALKVHLDFEISGGASHGLPDADQPPTPQYTETLRGATPDLHPLRPIRLSRQLTRTRLGRVMRLGGLAAAIVLSAEAMLAFGDIRDSTSELRSLEPRLVEVRDFNEQSGRAVLLASELGSVRGVIDERVGDIARWAPALNVVAGSLAENTQLIDCRGYHESGFAWIRMSGEVGLRTSEDRTLGALLDTLEQSDMIDLVELESARIEQREEGTIQRFVLRVRLVTEPAAPEGVVLASLRSGPVYEEGGEP